MEKILNFIIAIGIFAVLGTGIRYCWKLWRTSPQPPPPPPQGTTPPAAAGTPAAQPTTGAAPTESAGGWTPKFVKNHPWWTATIILVCLALLPEIVAVGKSIATRVWEGPNRVFRGTPRSEWGIFPSSTPATDKRVVAVNEVDQSDVRLEHFVKGPREWGWQTLPTEVEGVFPIDDQERYTGLNVSLLQGSRFHVHCPGYSQNGSYTAFFKTTTTQAVSLDRSGEVYRVSPAENLSGALTLKWRIRDKNETPRSISLALEVLPLKGHTRIATWKVANGEESLNWGLLPDPKELSWSLYVRFADECGITLRPSVIEQYPATLHIGTVPNPDGPEKNSTLTTMSVLTSKVLSEPERVLGDHMATQEDRFLAIVPPEIPGAKVRIEVILDIVPR